MKHPFSRKSVLSIFVAGVCSLCVSLPAIAQNDLGSLNDLMATSPDQPTQRSLNGRIRLFHNILIHPMPVWSSFDDGPAPAERSKIKTGNKDGLYRMSMVPQDEDFKDWKNLFTVSAHEKDRRAVIQQGRVVVEQFRALCSPSNSQVFRVDVKPNRLIQVVACGNYSRDRAIGQMAAIVTLRNDDGLVTLTRQWKTPSFQSRIPSNWPVPKAEMDKIIGELSRSRLIPLKNKQG